MARFPRFLILWLCVVTLQLAPHFCTAQAQTNANLYEDLKSLLEFAGNFSAAQDGFATWQGDVHVCTWTGVQCSLVAPVRVTGVTVISQVAARQVSSLALSALAPVDTLEVLILVNLGFSGAIPNSLSNLKQLRHLNLSHNALFDTIPTFLGSTRTLRTLDLSNNLFSGEIPSQFGQLTALQTLSLSHNILVGILPLALNNLPLKTLNLSHNTFSGGIPPPLLRHLIPSISTLDLSSCNLSGTLPPVIGNCRLLQLLNLSQNNFSGELPSTMTQLASLSSLQLNSNNFSGPVPSWLVSLENIVTIDISSNGFTGSLPDFTCLTTQARHGPLTSLQHLLASDNRLQGPIPASLGSCLHLTRIDLSHNVPGISGPIPSTLTGCASLTSLHLANNHITGSMPRLDAWPHLSYLNLHSNLIIGDLQIQPNAVMYLDTLDVGSNNLSGPLPKTLDSSLSLSHLDLSSNTFSASIPPTFGLLSSLTYLDISHNPSLSGPIPPSLSHFPRLTTLNLTSCNLSGAIPPLWAHRKASEFTDNKALCGAPLPTPCQPPTPTLPSAPPTLAPSPSYTLPPATVATLQYALPPAPPPPLSTASNVALADSRGAPAGPNGGGKGGISTLAVIGMSIGIAVVVLGAILLFFRHTGGKSKSRFGRSLRWGKDDGVDLLERGALGRNMSRRGSKRGSLGSNEGEMLVFESLECEVSLEDLLSGTKYFDSSSRVQSQSGGSMGVTYRGELRDGTEVAIKRLPKGCLIPDRDLRAELVTLGGIRHRHLSPLLAAYLEPESEELLLVTRWSPRGSLDALLAQGLTWQWPARQRLAVGAAVGLKHMHTERDPRMVHRDFKAGNLLVGRDGNGMAMVGDFGMGRLVDVEGCDVATWRNGTPGYAAPEFVHEGRVSTKTDVYSFGVVLLQLVTGRAVADLLFLERGVHKWAKTASLEDVVDERMEWRGTSLSQIIGALQLGIMCTAPKPGDRPSMGRVVQVLGDLDGLRNNER